MQSLGKSIRHSFIRSPEQKRRRSDSFRARRCITIEC